MLSQPPLPFQQEPDGPGGPRPGFVVSVWIDPLGPRRTSLTPQQLMPGQATVLSHTDHNCSLKLHGLLVPCPLRTLSELQLWV